MKQLTLVLPFALTPPEFAKDLASALEAPALSMLLARNKEHAPVVADSDHRMLPHETWLAQQLGADAAGAAVPGRSPFAPAIMRSLDMTPQEGYWYVVQPVDVQLARTHLTMADPRALQLDEADSRALFELAKPYFDEAGNMLLYGNENLWFMRADDWSDLRTASPDAAVGGNLSDWMPEGEQQRAFRLLQNEVQMLWYNNPVNEARQQRGLPQVNSFWMWGGAPAAVRGPAPALAASNCEPWLTALAQPALRNPDVEQVLAQSESTAVVLGDLIASGRAGEWSPWLMDLQRLEQQWFAPLLEAVRQGRIGSLELVFTSRTHLARHTVTKGALRKFWRKPTLEPLCTGAAVRAM